MRGGGGGRPPPPRPDSLIVYLCNMQEQICSGFSI